jgi:hypothetical protein
MRNSKTSALPTDCTSGLDGVCLLSELSTPLSLRIVLDPYIISRSLTSSKLANKHMQRKKSQHNETLKESFQNIIIFKECLMNTLENSTRHKPEGKIELECKGNKAYPEAKHQHDFPSLETPF